MSHPVSDGSPAPRLRPPPGEPVVTSWRSVPVPELLDRLGSLGSGPRRIVAINGRSGGGKTTLASQLARAASLTPQAARVAVVSSDDLAWHHSLFDWHVLARSGVFEPFRRGDPVDFRPPAWEQRGRTGSVRVPAEADLLLFEGVGAGQRALLDALDGVVWVQSDAAAAERLGLARDIASGVNGDARSSVEFWHEWMAQELPFLAADRPWEQADVIVAGASDGPQHPGHCWVAVPPVRASD